MLASHGNATASTDDAAWVDGEPETLVLVLDDERPNKSSKDPNDAPVQEPETLLLTINGGDTMDQSPAEASPEAMPPATTLAAPADTLAAPADTEAHDLVVLRDLEQTPLLGLGGDVTLSGDATFVHQQMVTFA